MNPQNKLDHLINDWIFDVAEPRSFSTDKEDNAFLVKVLEAEGYFVVISEQPGYFYCTMTRGDFEVSADSRANLRPRNIYEAVCLAALKVHIPERDQNSWNKIYRALDLNHLVKV